MIAFLFWSFCAIGIGFQLVKFVKFITCRANYVFFLDDDGRPVHCQKKQKEIVMRLMGLQDEAQYQRWLHSEY